MNSSTISSGGGSSARCSWSATSYATIPDLVARVAARGHEVGLHGATHTPLPEVGADTFRRVTADAMEQLAQTIQAPVQGFRAPIFSLVPDSRWAPRDPVRAGLHLQLERATGPQPSLWVARCARPGPSAGHRALSRFPPLCSASVRQPCRSSAAPTFELHRDRWSGGPPNGHRITPGSTHIPTTSTPTKNGVVSPRSVDSEAA